MAKRPLTLKIRIPPYETPRNAWRRKIHAAVVEAQRRTDVQYAADDRLEVDALIYMDEPGLAMHDVDNRVKDILDALQGRAGGPKSQRALTAIIPNDAQIYRIIVEKRRPPGQSHGMGHLIVRRLGDWKIARKFRVRRTRAV